MALRGVDDDIGDPTAHEGWTDASEAECADETGIQLRSFVGGLVAILRGGEGSEV